MRNDTSGRRALPAGLALPPADVALAVGFAVAAQIELLVPSSRSDIHGPYVGNVALALATTLPLAWRRVSTSGAFAVVLAAYLLDASFQEPTSLTYGGGLPLAVLFFSVGRHVPVTRSAAWLGAAAVWLALLVDRSAYLRHADELVFDALVFAGAWLVGVALRSAATREHAARSRAHDMVAEQEARERQVLGEERERIARELHDVIAHSVSVMVVQAGAAERVLDQDAGAARRALASVRRTGADTVAELQRLLGVLREDPSGAPGEARPGLSALDALVSRVHDAGLHVELDADEHAGALSPGIDQAAYRIVQESLTNVLKHSDANRVRLGLQLRQQQLEIDVHDDGSPAPVPVLPGHGLVGMRERTQIYGGCLEAGPDPDGGFRVRAVFPASASLPLPSRGLDT